MRYNVIISLFGMACGYAFSLWRVPQIVLICVMMCDYITGVLKACYMRSSKTESGGLSSDVGFRGLAKKGVILIIVFVCGLIDLTLSTNIFINAVTFAFIANEILSIIENAGEMGIPLPEILTKMIDLLKKEGNPDD